MVVLLLRLGTGLDNSAGPGQDAGTVGRARGSGWLTKVDQPPATDPKHLMSPQCSRRAAVVKVVHGPCGAGGLE